MKVCDNVPISLILVHMSCHMPFKLWVKMPTCPATSQLSWEKPQSAWEADIAGLAEVLQTATLLSGWIEPKLLQMMCIYTYIYMCSHFRLKFLLGVVFLNSITGFQPWSHQVITYEISRPGIKKTWVVKYVQDCTAWNCLQLRWSNAEQKSQS